MPLANTPKPPYYTVIFTSVKSNNDGYDEMSDKMVELVVKQSGFLGFESAKGEVGITVSYWESLEAIRNWYANTEHKEAQNKGRSDWYDSYTVRIAKVEREYSFNKG
ncbi:MAG: antibiotic biosynthesis monooxygenase [Flavobacteriales bacterium]|nr:MAG: antibiotic biosynthesis monooxygenase [Flavobacteriales bacterium]